MAGFPTPTVGLFPTPSTGFPIASTATDPMLGALPSMQGLFGPGVEGQSLSDSIAGYNQSQVGLAMQQQQLALIQKAGLPLDSNPNAWTPQEAQQRLNDALAKIATVNPDLAKTLTAQMVGQDHPQAHSFWDGLKNLAGDILHPVVALGGKVLDILSRPAHIIPAIINNHEGSVWKDIGSALNGSDRSTWSDVLAVHGPDWLRNNAIVRGAVGFVGDIATDPLTYVTFGTAGIGRKLVADAASAAVAKHVGASLAEDAGIQLAHGMSYADYATNLYTDLLKVGKFAPGASNIDDVVAAGLAGKYAQAEAGNVAKSMLEAADWVHRTATSAGLSNLTKEIELSAGRKLTREEVSGILKNQAELASFGSKTRTALAVAQGQGVRFRFAIPFTDLRYMSPAMPFTEKVNFNILRNFMAGTSGTARLLNAVDSGTAGATYQDFLTWVEGGFKGLKEQNPELAAALGGAYGGVGSAYYKLSDTIGRITSQLSPGAQAVRGGGLLGVMAADWKRQARGWKNAMTALGWTVKDESGRAVPPNTFIKRIGSTLKLENVDKYHTYLESLPSPDAAKDIQSWWEQTRLAPLRDQLASADEATAPAVQEAINTEQERLQAALAADAAIQPGEKDILWQLRGLWDKMANEANKTGTLIGNVTDPIGILPKGNEADLRRWTQASRVDTRDLTLHVASKDVLDHGRRMSTGLGAEDLTGTGDLRLGYGIHAAVGSDGQPLMRDGAAGVDHTPVAVKLVKAVHVDRRPLEARPNMVAMDDSKVLQDAYDSAAATLAKAQEWKATKLDQLDPAAMTPELQTTLDEMVSAHLQALGYDSILVHEADGSVRATVFDRRQVKVLDPNAESVVADRGYVPRELSHAAQEFLRGKLPEEPTQRVIYGPPQLLHNLRRKFADLPLEEADAQVRQLLAERYGITLPDNIPVFERDLLRIHRSYVSRVTESVMHDLAAGQTRRMAALQEQAPNLLGKPVGHTLYDWRWNGDTPDAIVEKLNRKVTKAQNRFDHANRKALEAQVRQGQATADSIARIRDAMMGGAIETDFSNTRLARAVARQQDVTRKSGAQLLTDLQGAAEELKVLKAEEFAYNRAKARITLAPSSTPGVTTRAGAASLAKAKGRSLTPAQFDEMAAQGQLFLGQDGQVVTAQAALRKNGVRLRGIDTITGDTKAVEQRIRDIKTYLRSSAGGVPEGALGPAMAEARAAMPVQDRLNTELEHLSATTERQATYVARLMGKASDALEELNRAVAAHKVAVADVQPALVKAAGAPMGFVPLQIKGLEGFAMPGYLAAEMHAALGAPGTRSVIRRKWREFQAVWKEYATLRYPGFHVRNNYGAWFNNSVLGPTDTHDYNFAVKVRKANAFDRKEKYARLADTAIPQSDIERYNLRQVFRGQDTITYGDVASKISDLGLNAAHAQATGDIRDMVGAVERAVGSTQRQRHFIRVREAFNAVDNKSKYIPFSRRFGTAATDVTENLHRTAGWLAGMRVTSGDPLGARAFVMMRQGDYLDLTDYEAGFVKDLIPFYKWMRTNVPFQFHQLVENPARTLGVIKARNAGYTMQGEDPNALNAAQPDWLRQKFAIPMPFHHKGDPMTYLTLDLPYSDLYQGARDYVSSFLPLVRPWVESYIVGKQVYTGKDLTGKMVPLAEWAQLPGIKQVLEATGAVKQNTDGQAVVDDRVQNLFSMIPVFSRFRNWLYAEPGRTQVRASTLASTMLGFGIQPMSGTALTDAELGFYYDQIQPLMAQLKSMGITFPSARDLSPAAYQILGLDQKVPTNPTLPASGVVG